MIISLVYKFENCYNALHTGTPGMLLEKILNTFTGVYV